MLAYRRQHQAIPVTHAINGAAFAKAPYRLLHRCFVSGGRRTSALVRSVKFGAYRLRRGYWNARGSTGTSDPESRGPQFGAPGTPLFQRLINAWKNTPTTWYPIPVAVGALLLVVLQYRRKMSRTSKEVNVDEEGREVIKLRGPWQVHVLGALPLRNLSRVWGYLNSLELPVWSRPIGFRLYSYIFKCNLDEIEHADDLTKYASLGDFFYRRLKDGVRPVDDAILVSPADGSVLHFGTINDLRVEQVKGMTYSLDALLGDHTGRSTPTSTSLPHVHPDMTIVDHEEFANVNGIEYSLDQLLGGGLSSSSSSSSSPSTPSTSSTPISSGSSTGASTPTSLSSTDLTTSEHNTRAGTKGPPPASYGSPFDASVPRDATSQEMFADDTTVALELGVQPGLKPNGFKRKIKEGNALFFCVIYLAPGDYHRFHSPCAWVVEKRRHFAGELFSVSPYMAKRLENLFVLNERVALLGRWRYGFFGMVPVGATNVGSIKIKFDHALRTNVRGRRPPPGTFSEAVYASASQILGGQPLTPAQEMGGFCLGSTIVLVFEAPKDFEFTVNAGQKVRVGQQLGDIGCALNNAKKKEKVD